MAGTNITNLLEIIQRKIDAADSTSATQDLLYLLSAVRQGDGSSLELYDNTGAFPDLTDSAADTEMIAYKLDSDRLYFNVGVWKGKTLPPPPPPPIFQGTNFGYTSGDGNTIDKFPFASDANATDVGDLTISKNRYAGQSSADNGYTSAGRLDNTISKFPFSSDANATDVGDVTVAREEPAGQSSSENGYTSGGGYGGPTTYDIIDKFPFASDANASDVGDLTSIRQGVSGQSSTTHGYTAGGGRYHGAPPPLAPFTTIDKFPFASDANASDVGDLTALLTYSSGQSSAENGYVSGGRTPVTVGSNIISKFSFATDANASDVGDLTLGRYRVAGQSSTASGYSSGGLAPLNSNVIDKFPFSSDANASDVGNLTVARTASAGQQY